MKLAAFSDTHAHHRTVKVPDADVVIFAGDFMTSGYRHSEVKDFGEWFSSLPHKHKILVVGNHDRMFESDAAYCLSKFSSDIIYLEDSEIVINGVKFWGSPYQPWFYNWAFNVHRGDPIKEHWDTISADTDVLITHGPPWGILDMMDPNGSWKGYEHLGCEELWKTIHDRLSAKVHIFGHIHGGYGHDSKSYSKMIDFYNVAICDEQYRPVNKPFIIEV
jgi:Icc-related predicted phosphoesterase